MDRQKVRRLLGSRFKDQKIEEPRPGVFRVPYAHNGSPVGVYYVDCSNSVLKPGFDLEEYQEELLADDYYEQEGDLQWNFYLYFLCDDERYEELLATGRAGEIENDGVYARKYVTSQRLFSRELEARIEMWNDVSANLPVDIGERWSQKLEENRLAGAYMPDVSCEEVVRRYMEGRPVTEHVTKEKQPAESDTKLDFITELRLGGYRDYPKRRAFETGACNLFEGVNGAGKTSLLEAVELWTCGRTLRNTSAKEHASDIRLGFKGTGLVRGHGVKESRVYRARNLEWYGNHRSRGTELCYSFNRFNFYNTDAAISITSDLSIESINQALSSLVLGERANVIQGRLGTLLKLFGEELSRWQREFDALRAQVEESEECLRLLGSTDADKAKYFDRLSDELRGLLWPGAVRRDDEASLDRFLGKINESSLFIGQCRSRLSWLPTVSAETLRGEGARLGALLDELERNSRLVGEAESRLAEVNKDRERLSEKLNGLSAWVVERWGWLDRLMASREEDKEAFEKALAVAGGVKFHDYSDYDEPLPWFAGRQQGRQQELLRRVEELQKAIDRAQSRLGRAAALRAEIRAKSRALVAAEPGIQDCPVCGSHNEVGKLAEMLDAQSEVVEVEQKRLLQRDLEELEAARAELTEVRSRLDDLEKLKEAARLLSLVPDIKLSELARALSEVPNQLRETTASLGELSRRKAHVEDSPVPKVVRLPKTTAEGAQLSRVALDDTGEGLRGQTVNSYRAKVEQSLEALRELAGEVERQLAAYREERLSLIRRSGVNAEPGEMAEAELRRRAEQLRTFAHDYERAAAKFGAEPDLTLSGMEARLNMLRSAYDRYVQSVRPLEETARLKEQYEMKKRDAEQRLPKVKQKKELAERAVDTINDILERDRKENYLEEFFRMNAEELFQFFNLLHSPREFDSMKFDGVEGKITLLRKSGRASSLTEISSGQRAALSLSIFLALNRKLKKGPRFILFDDPVALIDDLNVLSFFDYLRDIVMTGSRQVFFATASQKIAELFRKKFRFLEDDFKGYTLER